MNLHPSELTSLVPAVNPGSDCQHPWQKPWGTRRTRDHRVLQCLKLLTPTLRRGGQEGSCISAFLIVYISASIISQLFEMEWSQLSCGRFLSLPCQKADGSAGVCTKELSSPLDVQWSDWDETLHILKKKKVSYSVLFIAFQSKRLQDFNVFFWKNSAQICLPSASLF